MGRYFASEVVNHTDVPDTADLQRSLDSVIATLATCAGHERRNHPRGRISVPVKVVPLDDHGNAQPESAVQAWSTTDGHCLKTASHAVGD